ncbi:MAG: ribosome maturation factor RimP [Candidatus Krumholzibacteria bacterium]|nr:ribosome maturation factor RimP [Candidatus Krumholzibacteria bacterium]
MDGNQQLNSLIEKELDGLGFELVRLDISSGGRKKILRLFVDREDGGVSIDDCVRLAKALGLVLEAEEIFSSPYNLEVSSPGINRPLSKPAHFKRFEGREVRVEYSSGEKGKAMVIGILKDVEEDSIIVDDGGNETAVEFRSILKARLHGETWEIGRKKKQDR